MDDDTNGGSWGEWLGVKKCLEMKKTAIIEAANSVSIGINVSSILIED